MLFKKYHVVLLNKGVHQITNLISSRFGVTNWLRASATYENGIEQIIKMGVSHITFCRWKISISNSRHLHSNSMYYCSGLTVLSFVLALEFILLQRLEFSEPLWMYFLHGSTRHLTFHAVKKLVFNTTLECSKPYRVFPLWGHMMGTRTEIFINSPRK